ncbi:MAG: hypothetical protein Q8P81_01815 [Nanoarchaeota archaeon]|nr:hypothetical protein [Nanoarchaeota archaeon]
MAKKESSSKREIRQQKKDLKTILLTIIAALAVVSFWRGVWGLMDLYFFPDSLTLSFALSIIIGISILYFTKSLIHKLS